MRYFLIFLGVLLWSFASANAKVILNPPIAKRHANHTEVAVLSQRSFTFSSFRLSNPPRLVIDISDAQLSRRVLHIPINNPEISQIRIGTQEGNDLRIVFDLTRELPANTTLIKHSSGYKLQINIGQNVSNALQAARTKDVIQAQSPIKTAHAVPKKNILIMIDPGHGGKDPGAIGSRGSHEKTIVLNIAKRLQNMINQQPNMRAKLTRDRDIFIPLRERIMIARRQKADMFISLHADAGSKTANGSSTYILSTNGASSEAARLLAKKENHADLIGGANLAHKEAEVAMMLLDLSLSATIESSHHLAKFLLIRLQQHGNLHKKNVERAESAVLKSPDIPSVLIETGFISNPSEEKRLNNPTYQQTIAKDIWAGISAYYRKYPATQLKVAYAEPTQESVKKPIDFPDPQLTSVSADSTASLPEIKLSSVSTPERTVPTSGSSNVLRHNTYQVRIGETLAHIAQRFQVPLLSLLKLNNLPNNQLRVPAGTWLKIP